MASQLTTKSLFGRKVVSSKGKKIGKVRRFVFHPSEKRVVGFTVKRPDAALMFIGKTCLWPSTALISMMTIE